MKTTLTLLITIILSTNIAFAQNVFKTQIGEYTVYTLSEGQRQGNTRILKNTTDEIIKQTAPDGTYPSATNCFLIQSANGKNNTLIDAGTNATKLLENLASIGVKPEDITEILITHTHGDHIGGLMKDGKFAFPNATIFISEKEHNYCIEKENKSYIAVTEAYKIKTIEPNKLNKITNSVLPDIFAIESYGHTPGHTVYLLNLKKNNKLLIWGDLTHAMAVQMPYPKVAVTYDTNPDEAVVSRLKILDYVAKNKISVAGMHIAYPAIGKITQKGEGFEFVPMTIEN